MRDADNPVKRRAEVRARALGKALSQVYREAGVNKAYLTEVPKNGWQDSKIRAIAAALDWDARDLLDGPTQANRSREQQNQEYLELSIDLAVRLLSRQGETERGSPKVGQLSRLLYDSLIDHLRHGEAIPSDASLRIWANSLLAAWIAASKK